MRGKDAHTHTHTHTPFVYCLALFFSWCLYTWLNIFLHLDGRLALTWMAGWNQEWSIADSCRHGRWQERLHQDCKDEQRLNRQSMLDVGKCLNWNVVNCSNSTDLVKLGILSLAANLKKKNRKKPSSVLGQRSMYPYPEEGSIIQKKAVWSELRYARGNI